MNWSSAHSPLVFDRVREREGRWEGIGEGYFVSGRYYMGAKRACQGIAGSCWLLASSCWHTGVVPTALGAGEIAHPALKRWATVRRPPRAGWGETGVG